MSLRFSTAFPEAAPWEDTSQSRPAEESRAFIENPLFHRAGSPESSSPVYPLSRRMSVSNSILEDAPIDGTYPLAMEDPPVIGVCSHSAMKVK